MKISYNSIILSPRSKVVLYLFTLMKFEYNQIYFHFQEVNFVKSRKKGMGQIAELAAESGTNRKNAQINLVT